MRAPLSARVSRREGPARCRTEEPMFITLLAVTFAISVGTAFAVSRLFDKPVSTILARIVAPELSSAWHRYITFAIYVVGVSGGVRVWALERYVTPRTN